ncbi:MAG TPA: hypothetical protein VH089_21535 [Streptosporangiaceae bacterium]|nr:hypothetical protein [Streptosporangiaceae bacterium]
MRRMTRWAGVVGAVMSLAAASGLGSASAVSAGPPAPAPGIAPSAVNSEGFGYVFYTTAGGTVEVKSVAGGGQYASLGGRLAGAPAAVVTAAGHEGLVAVTIFGRGTDHALWYTTCTGEDGTIDQCSGSWASLGGALSSAPGVVDGQVYVRGTDGAVWGRSQVGTGWRPWSRVGGALLPGTAPSATATVDGNSWVLVVGTNRQLYVHQVGKTGFTAVGGTTGSTPALVATFSALVAFARGTDNALWYHEFQSSTPGWHSLGGNLRSGVGAFDYSPTPEPGFDTQGEYGLGTDGQIWQHTDLASGSWSAVTP